MAVAKVSLLCILISNLVMLKMCKTVNAALSLESNIITCYESETVCRLNCSQSCYYIDSCNGSAGSMYACVSNTLLIIIACAVAVFLLFTLIGCILCCCFPCCCIARCIKRYRDQNFRQESESGLRVVMPVQQISPNEVATSKTAP